MRRAGDVKQGYPIKASRSAVFVHLAVVVLIVSRKNVFPPRPIFQIPANRTADALVKQGGGFPAQFIMAQRDADGYYTIVGRKKRFLKLFGNRVNLDEVERMLKAHFPQTETACAGRDDHLTIFATDASLLPAMRAYLAEKTDLNPTGFFTKAVAEIPKNESGKTLYVELEKYDD